MISFIRLMFKSLALIALFVLAYFFYSYFQNKNTIPEHIEKNQRLEDSSIDFTVYDLDTQALHLSSLKGKVIIINFWATWCAPCVTELPALNTLAGYFPNNVTVLAVTNEDTHNVKNFLMAFPVFQSNFIPSNIGRKKMLEVFSVSAFPETYILNKQRKLVEKIIGAQSWDSDEWKQKIHNIIVQ